MLEGKLGNDPMFYINQNTNSRTQRTNGKLNDFIDRRDRLITIAETSII